MSLTPKEQLEAASRFTAIMQYQLDTIPRADIRRSIKALGNADKDHDGVLSGVELAAAIAAPKPLYHKLITDLFRNACAKPDGVDAEKLITMQEMNLTRVLDVLNHPETAIGTRPERAENIAIAAFAKFHKIEVAEIRPEARQVITDKAKELLIKKDELVLDLYRGLQQNHEIGDLPKQILPMTRQELCGALGVMP